MPSNLLTEIREKAKKLNRRIVFPDALDERAIHAAEILAGEKIARITLIGEEKTIRAKADSLKCRLDEVTIVDPATSGHQNGFAETFYELRKAKGMTRDEAIKTMLHPLYFGAMMVREKMADGSVAGSLSTTGDVLRSAILCIGLQPNVSIVSSFFLMVFPEKIFSFADCAVVPDPTDQQLADIAISTAQNHQRLTGETPRVAMLSFSTKGSAEHPFIDKVRSATAIAKSKMPNLILDGEMQLDAAIVPKVAKSKAPGSPIEGNANVLIFPDLQSGNISYKLAQRLGGAEAIGPVVQGLLKPAFDLSRGCTASDIVNTTAINCVMGAA